MRLRTQLLVISLVTLALPWAGCQAIREMDSTLRLAQIDALKATASAVAARFASDSELSQALAKSADDPEALYAHALDEPIYVDGYGEDDWSGQNIHTVTADSSNDSKLSIAMGRYGATLYVFAKVDAKQIRYFRPSKADLLGSDYLAVSTENKKYALFASAPGRLQAIALDSEAHVTDKATVHQLAGYWLESNEGFQVEFSMPFWMAQNGITLKHISADQPRSTAEADKPPALITPLIVLNDELAVFSQFQTQLYIANPHQYRLASAGNLLRPSPSFNTHGVLGWVYRLALGKRDLPTINDSANSGRLASPAITQALSSGSSHFWYQSEGDGIAQAAVKIVNSGKNLGVVVAEQSEESLTRQTNDAFGRLLAFSFLASTVAAICLVGYATFLSIRIRRLNDATLNAVSESGAITDDFPISKSHDEIGELSRSYAQLLRRLHEYTTYLRTLSSKLSHELRTPLAVVRSSLDNLEQEEIGHQAAVYAERARDGSSRLSHILNAMSAASRVEQAIEVADREAIHCNELLSNLVQAYRSVYTKVGFNLSIEDEPENLVVLGSADLLVQALDKLVDNANDFSPSGGEIRLSLTHHENKVAIGVQNQGCPLPEQMRDQLFDSMVSIRDPITSVEDHANCKPGDHLGLGLYIVRLIADFHSGTAKAYNLEDGVVFVLELPYYDKKRLVPKAEPS